MDLEHTDHVAFEDREYLVVITLLKKQSRLRIGQLIIEEESMHILVILKLTYERIVFDNVLDLSHRSHHDGNIETKILDYRIMYLRGELTVVRLCRFKDQIAAVD